MSPSSSSGWKPPHKSTALGWPAARSDTTTPNYSTAAFRDVESIFRKQDRHSYQREFRFVIGNGPVSDAPLILEIGDIRDITWRFDFAELNGEKLLGGELAVPG